VAVACALACSAWGQGKSPPTPSARDSLPSQEYYYAYGPYLEGQFVDALKAFNKASDSGLKGANGRWVDSVPLYVMVGECHYQLGNNEEAAEAYRAAIQQYLKYHDFMLRVNWKEPRALTKSIKLPAITRNGVGKLASYPESEAILQGGVIGNDKFIIDTRRYTSIHIQELVRTLAIGIRRYGELLGPRAKYDPLLSDTINRLAARPTKPRHWTESLIDVLLGVANRAAGRGSEAIGTLRRGMLAAGEYEHPLTSLALLELGHIALAAGNQDPKKYIEAGDYFEKAAHAAVPFFDEGSPGWAGVSDLIEEAFRYGVIAHRLANHQRPFSLAEPMATWAGQRKPKLLHLQTSLLLDAAEGHAGLRHPGGDPRQTAAADNLLVQARRQIFVTNKGEMAAGRIAARYNHLEALVRYQQGRVGDGDAAIGRALDFQRRGSLWLYHLARADEWGIQAPSGFGPRDAISLYEKVLREPERHDWHVEPLESLTLLTTPHGGAMERWFRKTLETNRAGGLPALEIADLIRRHRFSTAVDAAGKPLVDLGGRLLSLRWLLDAPREQLDDEAARQRDTLLAQFKDYGAMAKQVQELKAELQRIPLALDGKADKAAADDQKAKLAEIARLSELQEVLLRQMAVDRVHAPLMFPPKRATKDVQESLAKGQALLIFFATTASAESPSRLYAFLLTHDKEKYPSWAVGDPTGVVRDTQKLLREMGHFARDREVPLAKLRETDWQTPAAEIFKALFSAAPSSGTPEEIPAGTEELVIVPDGMLWYVPFEALQVPSGGGKLQSLISKYRVRYAPTMSLAVPDRLGRKSGGNLAVAVGQLMPGKGEDGRAKSAFDEVSRVMPTAVQLPSLPPASSAVYSTLFDRLLVLDDVDASPGPLAFRPIRGKSAAADRLASPLEAWMALPWGSPDQVMLPGFHTAAENGLSDKHSAGADVFLSTLGMMATGSRTILLSRWRTGGKTSFDLVREFAQELPQTSAAAAWQRSVLLCTESPLVPDQEPRVATAAGAGAMNASHPFFWSGYMVVDTGIQPAAPASDPAPKPAIRAAALPLKAAP
jgi:CHAT domain-containing protein